MGIDVSALETTSAAEATTPGMARPTGKVRPAEELAELVAGLVEQGVLEGCAGSALRLPGLG